MLTTSPLSRRWAVPAVAVAAVAAVTVAPRATAASAHPVLPARTAAQLLAAVETSHVQALSGTIRTSANLGLPSLPDSLSGGGSGLQALLTGTHTLRLSVDGPDRQRIALLGDLAETDVVHNGQDVWTYQSQTNAATHLRLPTHNASASHDSTAAEQLTPQAQADKALAAIDPSTTVSVDRTARVAGRPAYLLVLAPRTTATLVRQVTVAVDAATGLPLRVQVFAAGSSAPAFQTGFTSLSLTRPRAGTFTFAPPRGATVTSPSGHSGPATDSGNGPRDNGTDRAGRPTTVGTGWATVLELPPGTVGARTGDVSSHGRQRNLLDEVTTAVPQGRLLTTRLLTALITPDGRVYVGAVPAATVEHAAGA